MQEALDRFHSAIEARTVFLEPRPATVGSTNLLHDLKLFQGSFIQSWHPATEQKKAYFTTSQDYNSQSLARSLYAWGMWRGFLEDHNLSEEEFQEFRFRQSGGDPKSMKMDACVFSK